MYGHATKSVTSQCQIVVFPWVNEVLSKEVQQWSDLVKSSPLDVSAELEGSISFDKDLSSAAGTFSFTLPPTQDWKKVIKPGQWCLIYMTNDGDLSLPTTSSGKGSKDVRMSTLVKQKKRLRGICYIDRVAPRSTIEGLGVAEVAFEVTGKDFGIIYDGTEIWQNFFYFEQGIIDAAVTNLKARGVQTIDALLETIHGLFYSPQDYSSVLNQDPSNPNRNTLSQVGFQWLLPQEMVQALGLSLREGHSFPFWGSIDDTLNLSTTKATYPIENPLSTLNGNAWKKLKEYSLEQLHELFTEIDEDGNPKIVFRPIPWKSNPSGYPRIAPFIMSLPDLWNANGQLTIPSVDILDFDVGEDSHNRYNHFYTSAQQGDMSPFDNISELQYPSKTGRQFPFAQLNSIARHGFRPMHVELNAMVQLGLNVDGKADQGILVEYNEVIYDYWNVAIFLESGTIEVIGNNKIKCGRAIKIDKDQPYLNNKLFYIEGYTDHFTIEGNGVGEWTQTLKVTRGAPLDAYLNSLGINANSDTTFTSAKDTFTEAASFVKRK